MFALDLVLSIFFILLAFPVLKFFEFAMGNVHRNDNEGYDAFSIGCIRLLWAMAGAYGIYLILLLV